MKATETIKGQISKGLNGLGTVTPDMVEQRAKEIALINGRAAEEFNEADLEEAHHTCANGLMVSQSPTLKLLEVTGARLIQDAIEPLEQMAKA